MNTLWMNTFIKRLYIAFSGLRYIHQSRLRTCLCCGRNSIFISLSASDERKICLFCRANLRNEMLANIIKNIDALPAYTVLELAPSSPLKYVLNRAGNHIRTFYSDLAVKGSIRGDGARCEDITQLTFADNSIDMIVSGDVLEHVEDLPKAFDETRRVLKIGGKHYFTVPTHKKTIQRAKTQGREIVHLEEPEYHSDPFSNKGILAFWSPGLDFGDDQIQLGANDFAVLSTDALPITIADGPKGKDGRVVWVAEKRGDL